jgi:hypothetical protein
MLKRIVLFLFLFIFLATPSLAEKHSKKVEPNKKEQTYESLLPPVKGGKFITVNLPCYPTLAITTHLNEIGLRQFAFGLEVTESPITALPMRSGLALSAWGDLKSQVYVILNIFQNGYSCVLSKGAGLVLPQFIFDDNNGKTKKF